MRVLRVCHGARDRHLPDCSGICIIEVMSRIPALAGPCLVNVEIYLHGHAVGATRRNSKIAVRQGLPEIVPGRNRGQKVKPEGGGSSGQGKYGVGCSVLGTNHRRRLNVLGRDWHPEQAVRVPSDSRENRRVEILTVPGLRYRCRQVVHHIPGQPYLE